MATTENRRRKKDRRAAPPAGAAWGDRPQHGVPDCTGVDPAYFPPQVSEEHPYDEAPPSSLWRRLWQWINLWSLIATALYVLFIGALALLALNMWKAQDMRNIAGYTDNGTARDLTVALNNANGAEIVFTEGEVNRYLRDTCRLRQTGIFSVLANAQGVAIRMHDGYAELIIDRMLSTHFHQTTAVNLTFVQEDDHGRPVLKMEMRGGEPILGSLPRGGRIGQLGVPQRYMQMLRPALETIRDCYPEFFEKIAAYGYRPEFYQSRNGEEGYVRLIPYRPPSL